MSHHCYSLLLLAVVVVVVVVVVVFGSTLLFPFWRTLQRRHRHRHRHPIDVQGHHQDMEGGDRGVRGTLPIVLVVTKPCDDTATILLLPMAAATATDQAQNQETAMNVTIITEDALIVA